MTILQKSDVQITFPHNGCFEINTSFEVYSRVRSHLKTMKNDFGLPVDLHSESVQASSGRVDGNTVIEEGLPPRWKNTFIVVAWHLLGRNVSQERVLALAYEVGDILESKGLVVAVYDYES